MRHLPKKDFTILLGNALDHFDTSIYAFLAPIMAPLFFPHYDPVVGLIMAYSIFATSVVTRPVGAYIFGIIAQGSGPERALSYSLMGVGVATFFIGVLPDYTSAGVIAPILLIIFRMVRGIFAAGESSIAKLYILHNKEEKEAFKNSYLYQVSSTCGLVLASVASTLVYYLEAENSWRGVFFFGGSATIIGYMLRNNSDDKLTKKMDNILNFYSYGGIKILWQNRVDVLRIAMVNGFSHLTYSVPFITMNHLIPLITNIELKIMMVTNSLMLIFDMIAIPVIGSYVSRFNQRSVMFTASLVLATTIMPIWYFLDNASIIYVNFVRFWIVIWGIVFLCPLNLWCYNQIPGDKKYIIVGMGTTLGGSVIGKMSPLICLFLYYNLNSYMALAFYIAGMFAITAIVLKKKLPTS